MSTAVAVDFDKTLATYDGWKGHTHLGEPVPLMVEKVKQHLADGDEVWIFTARLSPLDHTSQEIREIELALFDWCSKHIGQVLPVTSVKRPKFTTFYDDRAVQVMPNTGITVDSLLHELLQCIHHDQGQAVTGDGFQASTASAIACHRQLWATCRSAEADNIRLRSCLKVLAYCEAIDATMKKFVSEALEVSDA